MGLYYQDQLRPNELSDLQQISISRHSQKEGNRIADVSNDKLDGQRWIVDIEVPSPPGQQTIGKSQESDDT